MTVASASSTMSPQAYLAFDRQASVKHEFWRGEVFAMAGASRRHNVLVGNLIRLLGNALLDRPCEVYPSDMRVGSEAGDVFTYPDVTVMCGEPRFADDMADTLLNPVAIVEVLSESTEAYDRGKKFEHYRGIPSVQCYLLVAQDHALVELYTRRPDGSWSLLDHRPGQSVELTALDCSLSVDEIYRKVLEPDAVQAPP